MEESLLRPLRIQLFQLLFFNVLLEKDCLLIWTGILSLLLNPFGLGQKKEKTKL